MINIFNLLFSKHGTISRFQFVVTTFIVFIIFAIIEFFLWHFIILELFNNNFIINPIHFPLFIISQLIILALFLYINICLLTKRHRGIGDSEENLNWLNFILKPSLSIFFEPKDTSLKKIIIISPIVFFVAFIALFTSNFIMSKFDGFFNNHPAVIAAEEYLLNKDLPLYGSGIHFSTRNISINDSGTSGNATIEFDILGPNNKEYGNETVNLSKDGISWVVIK